MAPQVAGLLLILLLVFCATVDAVGEDKADFTAHLSPCFKHTSTILSFFRLFLKRQYNYVFTSQKRASD